MPKNKKALKVSPLEKPIKKQSSLTGRAPGVGYSELVKKIKAEFSTLEQVFKKFSAECYRRVGEHIHKHILQNKDRADYGQTLFPRLAKDVGRDPSTLLRILKFYRTYPILARGPELSWSHYRNLMVIEDKSERTKLESEIVKKHWNAQQLQGYLSKKRLSQKFKLDPAKPIPQLSVTRSRLFAYKVVEPSNIHPIEGKLVVDIGFSESIHAEIKGLRLKEGEILESSKNGEQYSFKRSDATPKELYTYKALVARVIDGDTSVLDIDQGFSCWKKQKIRLRGIDCSEIDTPEGKKAKAFVEAKLKQVNFVVVKTYKDDKYGRVLADVFYMPGEDDPTVVLEKGVFLNQELLNEGLAIPF